MAILKRKTPNNNNTTKPTVAKRIPSSSSKSQMTKKTITTQHKQHHQQQRNQTPLSPKSPQNNDDNHNREPKQKSSTNANPTTSLTPKSKAIPKMKKQNSNTVFFRFKPSTSPNQAPPTRSQFESFFSDVGPVKKCSLIRKQAAITPITEDADKNDDEDDADGRPTPKGRREAKGYGFCKFTCQEDAIAASQNLNETSIRMEDGRKVKVWVEVGADATKTTNNASTTNSNNTTAAAASGNEAYLVLQAKKRTSRVILRNLSFYATERDIRRVMEERFGKVVDINLPLVPNYRNKRKDEDGDGDGDGDDASKRRRQHRGFAFVTFDNPKNARLAVESCAGGDEEGENTTQVLIKKRPVAIDLSLPKVQHKVMLKEQKEKLEEEDGSDEEDEEGSNEEDDSDDGSTDDDKEGEEGSTSDSDSSEESDSDTSAPPVIPHDQTPRNALFLRNLPFDATRHDVFTAFYRFGHIDGIFLVKDRTTNISRGTAFVNYKTEEGCRKAILAAATRDGEGGGGGEDGGIEVKLGEDGDKDGSGGGSGGEGGGLYIHGRRILVDLAVDRKTAESLKVERDDEGKTLERRIGKDRRNMYLKGEGRVEGTDNNDADANAPKVAVDDKDAWENLPEGDQLKRGRAHKEKHTKLRSPLFFINPFRLSIRNLNKGVDEATLKALVVRGILKGLERGLVTREDVRSHWRAGGDMTTRDIVKKIAEIENEEDGGEEDKVIPTFDDKRGVKKYVPSVYIDRDFAGASATTANTKDDSTGLLPPPEEVQPSKSKILPPSRGFGFVEFTEHAHALACLRELNNNVNYSSEFVAGGRKAIEMKRRIKNNGGKQRKKQQHMSTLGDDGTKVEDFMGSDGRFKIPRLIVEFTVENKAKAKKQAERKALQFANVMKQKKSARQSLLEEELKEDDNDDDAKKKVKRKMKKKSRGALQRERKRNKKEEGGEASLTDNDTAGDNGASLSDPKKQIVPTTAPRRQREGVEGEQQQQSHQRKKSDIDPLPEVTPQKAIKPPKKKKKRTSKSEEKDESAFEDMVRSYKKSFGGGANGGVDDIVTNITTAKESLVGGGAGGDSPKGRWFD